MKVTVLDTWASSNAGFLHRTPTWVKLVTAAVLVGVVVATWDPVALAGMAALIALVGVVARLPMRTVLGLAAYPLLFSGVLVLTTSYGATSDWAILLKTYTSALVALTIGFTTPYPILFGALGRVLPAFVNDSLLMTYRSLFILADVLTNLMTAVHLRGATTWRHPIVAMRSLGLATANLVLSTFDLAQADYEVMRLRGYQGRIVVSSRRHVQDNDRIERVR